jgi:hypothetical protein
MSNPRRWAVLFVTIILSLLAIFQLLLALGLPLGRAAWGGQHEVLPVSLRIGSLVAIVIYAVVVLSIRARNRNERSRFGRYGAWIFGIYFAFGVLLNVASSSPWERFLMAPVSGVLAVLLLLIARGRSWQE